MRKLNLEKYWGIFKTKKALDYFKERYEQELDIRYAIFGEYIPRAAKYWKKKVWKVNRKDLADRVFSDYVRLYYADDYWYVKCFTSGFKLPRYEAQNWHYRSRDYLKYRFDIRNCHPQTLHDNLHLNWNYRNYHKNMIAEYWEEIEEQLWNDRELVDYDQERYEIHILERYRFILEKKAKLTT